MSPHILNPIIRTFQNKRSKQAWIIISQNALTCFALLAGRMFPLVGGVIHLEWQRVYRTQCSRGLCEVNGKVFALFSNGFIWKEKSKLSRFNNFLFDAVCHFIIVIGVFSWQPSFDFFFFLSEFSQLSYFNWIGESVIQSRNWSQLSYELFGEIQFINPVFLFFFFFFVEYKTASRGRSGWHAWVKWDYYLVSSQNPSIASGCKLKRNRFFNSRNESGKFSTSLLTYRALSRIQPCQYLDPSPGVVR